MQGAKHVDATYFQQNGTRPYTTNVVLDVLYDVYGNHVLLNRLPECFQCGWSWPPCSPDMNPCRYFLWGYLRNSMYHTNPNTVQEL